MISSKHSLRLAGAATLLAAAFFVLPAKADSIYPPGYVVAVAAGAHDGSSGGKDWPDESGNNSTYNPSYTSTPCQTCASGAGMSGTVNYQPYDIESTPRCESCTKGS